MVNFSDCLETERRGVELALSVLREKSDFQFYIESGPKAVELQITYGDIIAMRGKSLFFVEVKTENRFTGNLFIETESNRTTKNAGWFFKSRPDFLFYAFLDEMLAYMFCFDKLFRLLSGDLEKFKLVKQTACEQKNETFGRLVPIPFIGERIGYKFYDLKLYL